MSESIGYRIKLIRKDHDLTMQAFGESLGMSKASISGIESGKNGPSEQTIRLICSTYCVDYFWLTEGTGEQYIDDTDALIESLAAEKKYNERTIQIVKKMFKLPPKQFDLVMELIDNLKEER